METSVKVCSVCGKRMRRVILNSYSILNRMKNHLCQLSKVAGFNPLALELDIYSLEHHLCNM